MFRKIILCIALLTFSFTSFAQFGRSCPKVYVGPSLGLNNPVGLLGVNIDVPIASRFSLATGAGISTWGYKTAFEGRYYFKDCNRGWALAIGATYNSGLPDFVVEMPTTAGDQDVTLDLEPVPAAFFSAYHFFNLGKGGNRFYLQFGWSQRFVDKPYSVKSAHTLTTDGDAAMQLLSPGGLILGLGFSFGIGG